MSAAIAFTTLDIFCRYMGVQLAKVLGAAHVITAATGDGIALAKSLGAEAVADYKVGFKLNGKSAFKLSSGRLTFLTLIG